ncbi:selenocysteine-specific translation elongation factor [Roseicella aerolata]|uniref:Selenocysteine-specific translation elongation factor n=1 Tax=Roseicella aerolata TaxID=2883479 RepID=A0A9X1IET8_9PROT|nr:selenocysteine-specific translation elongation factor [Roseicella aerolata]MCB4823470.1 selenocysteine-specific translation elongation factor [Roseicella aerolata]
MRTALIGVLGHVDHGKTALVRALTGTETDRLPEEKARGISIALGFARLRHGDAEIDLVDVPGHERFIRTMVAGATAMQAALLCVDAQEGVRPQTTEHAAIAALLGIRRGVVAVTRCDRAGPGEAARAAAAARALLARLGLGDWPVVATSAVTGEGMAALAVHLDALARAEEAGSEGAWLPVDRAFSVAGAGTVVTGALRRAPLAVGEEVEILPTGLRARVRGLQRHGVALDRAPPGRRTAVALRGVTPAEVPPGSVLATPGLLAPSLRLDARVVLLASAPRPLARGEALRLLCGTAEAGARLHLLDREAIAPGEGAVAQLRLDAPMALPAREPVVLRLASPCLTLGGGVVLDPAPPRRPPRDAPLLAAMAQVPPLEAAALRLREAGPRGVAAADLARIAGLLPGTIAARLPGAVRLGDGRLLDEAAGTALEAALLAAVEAAQRRDPAAPGATLAELRPGLPEGAPLPGIAARLVAAGALELAGGRLTRRGLDPLALLPPEARAVLAAVEAEFRRGGLAPPETAAVAGGDRRRAQALALLLRRGTLVRAPDAVQKREYLFHREALAAARAALGARWGGCREGFLVGECARLLGITRRHGVPLLERLDAEGFTRRDGDRRRIAGGGSGAEPQAGPPSPAPADQPKVGGPVRGGRAPQPPGTAVPLRG